MSLRRPVDKTLFSSQSETIGTTTIYKDLTDDLAGYGSLIVACDVTAVSGGGDTIAFQLQDSIDGTSFASISGAAIGANAAIAFGIIRVTVFTGRYIRMAITGVDTANGATFTYSLRVFGKS